MIQKTISAIAVMISSGNCPEMTNGTALMQKGEPMGCDLYKVTTGSVDVARYMPLETALILVKALMMEYYADSDIEYTIRREERINENN